MLKKFAVIIFSLFLVGLAGWWTIGPDWRALLRNPPLDTDVLFWSEAQRDAAFRMMDRVPMLATARTTETGEVRLLEQGTPLDLNMDISTYMGEQRHAGLVVLQDGKIRLEEYGLDFNNKGRWTSFSVAKSFTSTLVGIAIKEGHISSLDSYVTEYITGLQGSAYDEVTIAQLLTMTSGVAWNEDYEDPSSDVANFNKKSTEEGTSSLVNYMSQLPRAHTPGTVWNYSTGETNLIGVLVSQATGRDLTDYLSEKIWTKIGMEQVGTWILGEDGHEISGCCIQAATRDYARFGQYILEGGMVDGQPTLPDGWLERAVNKQAEIGQEERGYGYQWWTYDDGSFAARGIFGQGIFIDPARKLVIASNSSWGSANGWRTGENARRESFYRTVQNHIDAETVGSTESMSSAETSD